MLTMTDTMVKPVKVTVIIDWADERARLWFGNMSTQLSHPQYRGAMELPEVSAVDTD